MTAAWQELRQGEKTYLKRQQRDDRLTMQVCSNAIGSIRPADDQLIAEMTAKGNGSMKLGLCMCERMKKKRNKIWPKHI